MDEDFAATIQAMFSGFNEADTKLSNSIKKARKCLELGDGKEGTETKENPFKKSKTTTTTNKGIDVARTLQSNNVAATTTPEFKKPVTTKSSPKEEFEEEEKPKKKQKVVELSTEEYEVAEADKYKLNAYVFACNAYFTLRSYVEKARLNEDEKISSQMEDIESALYDFIIGKSVIANLKKNMTPQEIADKVSKRTFLITELVVRHRLALSTAYHPELLRVLVACFLMPTEKPSEISGFFNMAINCWISYHGVNFRSWTEKQIKKGQKNSKDSRPLYDASWIDYLFEYPAFKGFKKVYSDKTFEIKNLSPEKNSEEN